MGLSGSDSGPTGRHKPNSARGFRESWGRAKSPTRCMAAPPYPGGGGLSQTWLCLILTASL